MPLLRLEGVSKAYGALLVTDDLTFEVGDGEGLGVGVIGPNGAGKTTLFNLITGDVTPDRGRIYFGGAHITAPRPYHRRAARIARTYQIPLPFVGMTVFENVLVGATFGRGQSERDSHEVSIAVMRRTGLARDRKSTRLNSSHGYISYAVFCLKKKIDKSAGCSVESH